MKFIKKSILSLIALFSVVSMNASNEPTTLVVETLNLKKIFMLDAKPIITFDSNKVYISTDNFSTELTDIVKFYFPTENQETTDINTVKDNPIAASVFKFLDGNTIEFSGDKLPSTVSVYSLQGTQISAQIEQNSSSVVVRLDQLPNGVYIVRTNNQSIKIYKK